MSPSLIKKLPVFEFCALIITLITLSGWHPVGSRLMSTSTALTFIIAITSKFFYEYSDINKRLLLTARILAYCTIVIGVIRIAAIIFEWYSINKLFFIDTINGSETSMVLVTAFSFVIIGIALYRITLYNAEKIFFPHVLSLIVLFIALCSAVAYFFNDDTFYGFTFYKPMAIATAINFFLLSFSILMVNKRKGFMGHITGDYQGAKIARLLIPMAIAIPILLGFFQLETVKTGVYTRSYNVALITLGRIVILVLFIWRTAVIINRSNKTAIAEIEERKKNEERLRYKKALLEAQNEAIPDAILVVDTKGKILSYNQHFVEVWRIPEEIIKNNDDTGALEFAMTQLEDPQQFIERVNYIYAHPRETAHDEILFKDGRIIERYGNVVTGDDGTTYGWAWYFRDITLNKNYENEIKNFSKYLEVKVKERTEKLNKSETRFRLLVENSSDIISLIGADGRILYMTPSIKRLTGFAEEELAGRQAIELFHEDDRENGLKWKTYLFNNSGTTINNSFRFLCKDGGYIWIEGTATNMLSNENVNAFVLNYKDITERKKSEESIRKSEKHFRSLIENAHDIISLSDENGMRFYVSPAIEKITGYSVQETINQPVFDIVHPDDIAKTKKLRAEFMREPGIKKPISFRFLHKNGGFVWIEGTIVNLLHNENVKAVVGNFHDVTERKISEEKIRMSNERFEMVSKATNDAVWDWDLDTDKIYWNDEIKSMFNYAAADIATGTEWKVHIHPEDFKRVTRKVLYHIKNGIQNWQDEYRFRCADGSYKYVFNRGFILLNKQNKPYRIIGAMQDVTQINKLQQSLNDERIKMQRELTNATIEGQEKERTEIGRELHDNINQLLTATKLYLDVASSQPSMKDEMIKRSTENLSFCMEEIRRLSSSLVPPSLSINSFEDIMLDLVEPIKLATKINIDYEVKDVSKNILSSNQQLNIYRIIQEHLNNIVKHSKANNVLIRVKHIKGFIEVNIKDDGQGFNVSARRKGIGFKNIQSRAELLNGKMDIISKPGKGCMLVVNFPLLESVIDE